MRFLNTILLVLILAAVCAAGALFYFGKPGMQPLAQASTAKTDDATPDAPVPAPVFLALDPFTVTLQDTHLSRILYLEITLRVADADARNYLVEYMPEVRNRILNALSRYTAAQVNQPESRLEMAQTLRKVISEPYPPRTSGPDVLGVLFTAFVVQ